MTKVPIWTRGMLAAVLGAWRRTANRAARRQRAKRWRLRQHKRRIAHESRRRNRTNWRRPHKARRRHG